MIIGIGEILWDNLPSGRRLGGAPANFAFHAGQLGMASCVVSAVGKDCLGDEIKNKLGELGVNYCITDVDSPTGKVIVNLDEHGVPAYDICEGVAWDNIPFTDKVAILAKSATVVCYGMLAQRNERSRETIYRFLKSVSSECLKVFDVNLRQNYYNRHLIEISLRFADVLKLNDDELNILKNLLNIEGRTEMELCCNVMNLYDVDIVVLTCGDRGSYVVSVDEVSYIETPKIEVVDTVGAGDAFTAAFVVARQKGFNIKESHAMAVSVATSVCMADGATPKLPDEIIGLFR